MARVVRFEQLLRRLRASSPRRWGQVAAECGYYDQAHMNRDFREFAGTTPTDYLARLTPAVTGAAAEADEVTSIQYTWVSAT